MQSSSTYVVEERLVKRKQKVSIKPPQIRRIFLNITRDILEQEGINPEQPVSQSTLKEILSNISIWDRILQRANREMDDAVARTESQKLIVHIRELTQDKKRDTVNVWSELQRQWGRK